MNKLPRELHFHYRAVGEKFCPCCCDVLPMNSFRCYTDHKSGKARLESRCRKCSNKRNSERRKLRYRTDPAYKAKRDAITKAAAKRRKEWLAVAV